VASCTKISISSVLVCKSSALPVYLEEYSTL
jgi:hypothetical protein